MQLIRHTACCPANLRGAVLALGNFDGIHQGHHALLTAANEVARKQHKPLAVMTFEPHPRHVFGIGNQQFRLTPLRTKYQQLQDAGVDALFVPHFNPAFAAISADDFIQWHLHENLNIHHVFVGYDFKFGAKRQGDGELLTRAGQRYGFETSIIDAQHAEDGLVCSSTRIREFIRNGEIAAANNLLGWPWQFESRVLRGQQLGRTLGFPTINVALGNLVRPKYGVYSAAVRADDNRWYQAVVNIGIRPTVDGSTEVCEAHLFDMNEDWYGKHVTIRLGTFIRSERAFESLEALKQQITKDIEDAKHHPVSIT